MKTAVVSGVGLVCSLGWKCQDVASRLRSLETGIATWHPLPDIPLPVTLAGIVREFDVSSPEYGAWTWPEEIEIDSGLVRSLPPQGIYAAAAIQQALACAGLTRPDLTDGDTGIFCASAGSPRMMKLRLDAMERTRWQRGHPLGIVSSIAGSLNFNFAAHWGIRGASCGYVSACASGAHALGAALDEIRLGRQRRMIVVAAEDLSVETLLPFHAMGALSTATEPAAAMRPFDAARSGFVGTGGAAVLVLEEESAAKSRGIRPLAKMSGWGQASDGWNVAAPHPEGDGLARAMRRALEDAAIDPGQVDYINAHGTGTQLGDRAEALAIRTVFAQRSPAVSSTKALTGHGLSLAGALEAVICVLALREGIIPGQAHLEHPLPEGRDIDFPRHTRDCQPRVVLNNSSGFGGANVCHVFTHA